MKRPRAARAPGPAALTSFGGKNVVGVYMDKNPLVPPRRPHG